jgi:hypothetical protein
MGSPVAGPAAVVVSVLGAAVVSVLGAAVVSVLGAAVVVVSPPQAAATTATATSSIRRPRNMRYFFIPLFLSIRLS